MTPKEEVEVLMNEGMKFASLMLSQHGEFLPFGNALKPDGRIVAVGASDGTEHPKSQTLIDLLVDGFKKAVSRGEYTAIGIFFDVRISRPADGKKVDAVQVGLEHKDGYCADVFFPYTVTHGQVSLGEIFAQSRDAVVFAGSRNDAA
jgi:hypothetical protein